MTVHAEIPARAHSLGLLSMKKKQEWDSVIYYDHEFDEVHELWEQCTKCMQDYQNALSVDMANVLVTFIQTEHPDDKLKLVEALHLKLLSLCQSPKTTQIDDAKECNETFSLNWTDESRNADVTDRGNQCVLFSVVIIEVKRCSISLPSHKKDATKRPL